MNTIEFLQKLNEIINTETKSSIHEAIKQTYVTGVFVTVTRDFFYWTVNNHRDILDEFLKERLPNAKVQEEDNSLDGL